MNAHQRSLNVVRQLEAELARVTAERDRLIEWHLDRDECFGNELWHALLPDSGCVFGWTWNEYEEKTDAIAAVRAAAGLDTEGDK